MTLTRAVSASACLLTVAVSVTAHATYVRCPDGSTATVEYLSRTASDLPKERFEVSGEGLTARCEGFRTTQIGGKNTVKTLNQDKGQETALREIVDAVREGRPSPFAVDEIQAVSLATQALLTSVALGAPVEVGG